MNPHLALAADYEAARELGPWLAAALDSLNSPQASRLGELELALHELAINIVDHAFDENTRDDATYSIELEMRNHELHAHFRDDGHPFVAKPRPAGDEPTIRGYGLIIVEQIASSVTYERVDGENRWTLVFGP